MITQYAAASLVSENKDISASIKCRFYPIFSESRRSCQHGNDCCTPCLSNYSKYRRVLSIEAICAAQAADIQGVSKLAPETRKFIQELENPFQQLQKIESSHVILKNWLLI